MKAQPVNLIYGQGYKPCAAYEATHVTINIPGPTGLLTLPVILSGTRAGTGCWTWNGSTDTPTLRPSVLTQGHDFRCHSWINDGAAQFLEDCSHALKGQTVPLLDVDSPRAAQEAEIARLNKAIRHEQNYLTHIGTHGPDCWKLGPQHYQCAVAEIARQEATTEIGKTLP